MWRIGRNFLSCIQNSALSSTFPVVFRCTKFQFCSSVTVVVFVCVSVCLSVPPLRASLLICMAQVRYQLAGQVETDETENWNGKLKAETESGKLERKTES